MPMDSAPTVRRISGREAMDNRSIRLGVLLLGVLLILTGCHNQQSSGNEERRGGFYSGVSGGWTHP